jgi:hypothetical protein
MFKFGKKKNIVPNLAKNLPEITRRSTLVEPTSTRLAETKALIPDPAKHEQVMRSSRHDNSMTFDLGVDPNEDYLMADSFFNPRASFGAGQDPSQNQKG